ncbi:TVG0084357 [Thermoplasma volcanium GSS1]|uniref:TVG0084357 protein n=1 Tax=Thermoplasma volcanium (strain ATCC 51530 / DSM 4299 / JCM 9571 / NBRC 15438 / GSS1) TaxID=273116 RepID=Q97CL7_THEVO|nr:hypothetical protein [Thermoplasma volcanium]BAB59226.1 TVG0084357 [Thermoplasma volcanium GSS1]
MPKPPDVGTTDALKKARKIATIAAVVIVVASFSVFYAMSLEDSVTVNVMYVNVYFYSGNSLISAYVIQYNHDTLSHDQKVTVPFEVNGGKDGITVNNLVSFTPGFSEVSLSTKSGLTITGAASPSATYGQAINIPAGETVTLYITFITPQHNYAGNFYANFTVSPYNKLP